MYLTSIMGGNMENRSLLNRKSIQITDELILRIPTVGEILDRESEYFSLISIMTSTPFQYMVQLDDLGIDYTTITDYEMFCLLFPVYAQQDTSIIFGNLDLKDIAIYHDNSTDLDVLYSPTSDIKIDELVYFNMAKTMRQVNCIKYERKKPKGENTKKYLLEKERRHLKNLERMRKHKEFEQSEFEKLIVALVNNEKFKYNYESIKTLSIYNFYQSFQQIQHEINFNNVMRGVYAGTIDTSKLQDRSCLSWIKTDK